MFKIPLAPRSLEMLKVSLTRKPAFIAPSILNQLMEITKAGQYSLYRVQKMSIDTSHHTHPARQSSIVPQFCGFIFTFSRFQLTLGQQKAMISVEYQYWQEEFFWFCRLFSCFSGFLLTLGKEKKRRIM